MPTCIVACIPSYIVVPGAPLQVSMCLCTDEGVHGRARALLRVLGHTHVRCHTVATDACSTLRRHLKATEQGLEQCISQW